MPGTRLVAMIKTQKGIQNISSQFLTNLQTVAYLFKNRVVWRDPQLTNQEAHVRLDIMSKQT